MNDNNLEELRQIILDYEIVCPISGTKNWTDVRQFNLMFSTEMGSTSDGAMKGIFASRNCSRDIRKLLERTKNRPYAHSFRNRSNRKSIPQ